MTKVADFRSDTVTNPTQEMRLAALRAEVGDDVYGDDPTVNQLEKLAAELLGKEAAVLVPTGTMGNQASIMAQTRPGDEIITVAGSHIVTNEAGGVARLSQVSCALAAGPLMEPEDARELTRADNIHYPRTSLICLENALGNGRVMSLEKMRAVYEEARGLGLKVHLDGARLFNAAVSLGVSAKALAGYADSLCFCLSKGLCAPVGSVICGSADFINEARRCRKVLGGGMRQAGLLAACGLVALDKMTARLKEDHEKAQELGRLLAELQEVAVDLESIEINMVFWRGRFDFSDQAFVAFMFGRGFKVSGRVGGVFRLVTHNDISFEDTGRFVEALKAWFVSLS